MSDVVKIHAETDMESVDGEPAGMKTPPPGTVKVQPGPDGQQTAHVPTSAGMPVADHPGVYRSLNDCLAIERTVLANERTLLAYFRSSLAVLVVAVTVIKFFTSQGMIILGYVLLVIGVACITVGLMRFTEMYHRINELGRCKDTKPRG
jgi:putative membrane protein